MRIKLTPDRALRVEKARLNGVPTLILRPAERETANVGLMWIHGGGFITGMKEMVYMSRAADLVKRYDVTVVSPGYRLAWMKPYPAAVEDCFAVLKYMDEHRAQLGVDRILVGGESAGGGLCAAVCMMARDRGIHVAFQFPLYPMLSNLDTESSRDNRGRIWNTRRNHLGWRLYLRGDAKNENVAPYASPARQTDYSGLPPCYTFVGEGEPFYAETLQYVEDLRQAGVPAEVDDISEALVDQVILKCQKTAKEQLDSCPDDRAELKAEYRYNYDVICEYAPRMMSEDEIRQFLSDNFADVLATKNKGQIMKAVMPALKGKADGKAINAIVAEICQ